MSAFLRATDDLATQRARLTRHVRRERLPVLVTMLACALLFVVGRTVGSAGRSSPPPWSPPRALPAATVVAGETDLPAIDNLSVPAPPAVHRRPHRSASQAGVGSAARSGSGTAATTPAASTQAPPAATTAPPHQASAPPASDKSGAGSSSPPAQKQSGGSSSGSFDSSG